MVRVTSLVSSSPRKTPKSSPAPVPTRPIRNASAQTSVKTSRRVTPIARSMPIRRRRRITEKMVVL